MQEKFIVWNNVDGSTDEPENTRFEYEIGDIINVNSYGNQFKCVKKEVVDGKLFQYFKQGKRDYTYDY